MSRGRLPALLALLAPEHELLAECQAPFEQRYGLIRQPPHGHHQLLGSAFPPGGSEVQHLAATQDQPSS
ncbi:MAG: hypothetical protein ACH34U_12550, partial [Cyanobium sp.]